MDAKKKYKQISAKRLKIKQCLLLIWELRLFNQLECWKPIKTRSTHGFRINYSTIIPHIGFNLSKNPKFQFLNCMIDRERDNQLDTEEKKGHWLPIHWNQPEKHRLRSTAPCQADVNKIFQSLTCEPKMQRFLEINGYLTLMLEPCTESQYLEFKQKYMCRWN